MTVRPHHHVYVIELSRDVLEEPKFVKANPQHIQGKPCVYVGVTGLTPEERFRRHRERIQCCRYVRDYGVRLRQRLYAKYNPMTYPAAASRERWLAARLRKRGYA